MIVGAVLGTLTLLFFMGLVLLGVFGHEVPCNSVYLVIITLSLGAALAAAFLGGNASAKGSVPFFNSNSLAIGVTGGVGVLLIMLVVTSHLFARTSCGPSIAMSCPQNFQQYVVEQQRFGFCYPRENWEVDAGAIGIDAADIYLRQSANRDVGLHFHVSLVPVGWANKPISYSSEVAKTWKQVDPDLIEEHSFVGGRDAYVFKLKVKDHLDRAKPTEVTHVYLDPERLLEAISTWFEDTPTDVVDTIAKVKSSLTFARV